jgi:hypothetical protein
MLLMATKHAAVNAAFVRVPILKCQVRWVDTRRVAADMRGLQARHRKFSGVQHTCKNMDVILCPIDTYLGVSVDPGWC